VAVAVTCCSCQGPLSEALDLGPMHLSDFTDPGQPRGEQYPLRLMLCDVCTLLQLDAVVPRDAVIHERYGFKSGINEAEVADLAAIAGCALQHVPSPRRWLDTGCNDGTLLAAVPEEVYRTGIDPVTKFAAEARTHADRVICDWFRPDWFARGEFDVVTSAAMLYALEDPGAFTEGVASVLARDGVWVIQVNYALDMLRNNVVDNIFHEHVTYWSVRSLKALLEPRGLEIADVTYSSVKGGCIRVAAGHRGTRPVSPSVARALRTETVDRLGCPETWQEWALAALAELAKTRHLAEEARARGERVYVYGASTRGGAFLQMIGAGPDLFPYAVERYAPKVGKIMASTGIPIISEEQMRADPPEYLLISPWPFRDVFLEREKDYLAAGGRLIFPLPQFEVVP
jgi:NDP-4-keto-2,6-dideoxyhexose 3-C-methyltransferase